MITYQEEELTKLTKHPEEWIGDCERFHNRVLEGLYSHFCYDWDMMPIDETVEEYKYCYCCKEDILRDNKSYENQ